MITKISQSSKLIIQLRFNYCSSIPPLNRHITHIPLLQTASIFEIILIVVGAPLS